jgi:cytochrome c
MKNTYVIILLLTICLYACNSENKPADKDAKPTTAMVEKSASDNPDYDKGLNLISKSDCWSCHKINEQLIGPAYNLIGQKYESTEANIELLAGKIMKGGAGVWGNVPMQAHPDISKEDAVAMVKYILLLKNEK